MWLQSGELTFIGTAFFIAQNVFVTAAHVVPDCLDDKRHPAHPLFIIHYHDHDKITMRRVLQIATHRRADVAVGTIEPVTNRAKNTPLRNRILRLTKFVPPLDSEVATWAFPKAQCEFDGTHGRIEIKASTYVGRIRAHFPDGRDSVMLPGPCYETTLAIENGASGGPVFDSDGRVFAVNSTGISGIEVGYVSHIQKIEGLLLSNVPTDDGVVHSSIRIAKLLERGVIPTADVEP